MTKRPMDTDLKTRMAPSLGLLTLAGLTCKDHDVIVLNENITEVDYDYEADLVGITVTLDVMPRARRIAAEFRRRGIPVAAGGIHVTCCPEDCLPHFDAICIGAAERVWGRMVEDTARGILRGTYHDMEGFRGEEIVAPSYDKVDTSRYLYTNVLTTSRGCPNSCDFCYNSCRNRVHLRRPIPDVLREIESLGTRHILFVDDNFIGDPAYTRELLEALRGLGLRWGAAVTTRILRHPELLDLMAEAGCHSLFIGFESINDSSLRSVHKGNRFEEYGRVVEAIHGRSIMVNASMVFGLDGDGPGVFSRTLDWLVMNRVETMTSHILTPYPGTMLHSRLEGEGRITDRDLARYNTANVVFRPTGMTAEELREGYLWMYRQFYSFRNIWRRMPEDRAQRVPYLLFNLVYRKFGRVTSALTRVIPMRMVGRVAARISYGIG